MLKDLGLVYILADEWKQAAVKKYGDKNYTEMHLLFSDRISSAASNINCFNKHVNEYLARIMIHNLRFVGRPEDIDFLFLNRSLSDFCYWTNEKIRLWEEAGESLLFFTGILGKDYYLTEGARSFEGAAGMLKDFYGKDTQRSNLNKMMADHFHDYVGTLRNSRLIESGTFDD